VYDIAKTMTAAAIMQMGEKGKVRLSDFETLFIPEFHAWTVLADSSVS